MSTFSIMNEMGTLFSAEIEIPVGTSQTIKREINESLIIDDEDSTHRTKKLLTPLKITGCRRSSNAEDALEKINELKPDLIFLDIQMPAKQLWTSGELDSVQLLCSLSLWWIALKLLSTMHSIIFWNHRTKATWRDSKQTSWKGQKRVAKKQILKHLRKVTRFCKDGDAAVRKIGKIRLLESEEIMCGFLEDNKLSFSATELSRWKIDSKCSSCKQETL